MSHYEHHVQLVRHHQHELQEQAHAAHLHKLAKAARPRGPTVRERATAGLAWLGRFVTQRHQDRQPVIQPVQRLAAPQTPGDLPA